MKNLNIVIPAGGEGKRFKEGGYNNLKPFITINGKTMIEHVIDGFVSKKYNVKIYIIMQEIHMHEYNALIKNICDKHSNVTFLPLVSKTEGTVCTILNWCQIFNNDDMVLSANCDQLADITLDEYIDQSVDFDGSLLVFGGEKSPNWSYVKIENDLIIEVVDKNPITDVALIGWYFWKKGSDMINSFIWLLMNNIRTKNEFMQNIPYNFIISQNKKVKPIFIDRSKVHGLGTPMELTKYLNK